MKQGLFLCIEGSDGSGKTTQYNLLADRLRTSGYAVDTFDFPQYGQPSAELALAYLNNEFGPAIDLDPRLASAVFAIDRVAAKNRIEAALEQGAFVLANRFTASNMAHQAAKIPDVSKHAEFFRWVHQLEHETLGIPEPDHHFLLHLPAAVGQHRALQKQPRHHTVVDPDDHESDFDYQERAEKSYLELAATFPDRFTIIECLDGERAKSAEEIHNEIWDKVTQRIPTR